VHLSNMKGIYCFLLLNILVVNLYAQQSALDSLAIKIQTHINKNKVNLNQGKYMFSKLNDSLCLGTEIEFINHLKFDRTKLKDSFEYNLSLINDPTTDTAIVDIYPAKWKIGDIVFPNYEVMCEFSGGFRKYGAVLANYIRDAGINLNDLEPFTLFFDDKVPSNLLYIKSSQQVVIKALGNYYKSDEIIKYLPPIRYGIPLFSSHEFAYDNNEFSLEGNEYNDYESLVISDKYIYSLSRWSERNTKDSILVFDSKRNLKDILSDKFLTQSATEHHSYVQQLVEAYYNKKWKSDILKFSIIPNE
jgi:hypothetical protein